MFALVTAMLLQAGCDTYTSTRQSVSGAIGTGRTFAIFGLEGRWAGDVTPAGTACGIPTKGIMTITSHGFAFDPFGSTFVITGTVSETGALQGTLKRVVAGDSSRHVERSLSFFGSSRQEDGGVQIDGRLESGRCTWQVALQRA